LGGVAPGTDGALRGSRKGERGVSFRDELGGEGNIFARERVKRNG